MVKSNGISVVIKVKKIATNLVQLLANF